MNLISPNSGIPLPAQLTPAQGALDIVGRVAAARIRSAMAESPERQVLFMIAGLGRTLTSAVALHIKKAFPTVTVELHVDVADETVPDAMISRRSLGDYRNTQFADGGGAIVFAPSSKELDDVGKTSGDIQQISEEILAAAPELWIQNSVNLNTLDDRNHKHLVNVLQGLVASQVLTNGMQMFGEFIWRMNDEALVVPEIERAIDFALPALRIPRGAGRFKKLAAKGRVPSAASWAERFRVLHATAEDSLHLRRDGTPLPRLPLKERLSQLVTEGEVDEAERAALDALIADEDIQPGMWLPTQAAVAELRSELVDRLVKAAKRKMQRPLGEATLAIFKEKMPKALTDDDKIALSSQSDAA